MAGSAHPRAAEWIERLGLEVLEGESGWWAPAFRSTVAVTAAAVAAGADSTAPDAPPTTLAAANAIYYLLEPGRPINAWHWLASDDTHVLIEGGPVEYLTVSPQGALERTIVSIGTRPMITVPAGSHKALRLTEPGSFALIGSVVTPAWTPERVRIAPPVIADLPAWLTPELMHALSTGAPPSPAHPDH